MPEITAKDVMKLRNKTGLAMMACKRALEEAQGDFDVAEDLLRKQLKGKMESRTDRAAGEGCIAVAIAPDNSGAAIVEFRAETDFTAKNERFVQGAAEMAQSLLAHPAGDISSNDTMTRVVDDLRASTGENCSVARAHKLAGSSGKTRFGSYVHHDRKTGVIVQAEGDISDETLKQLGMHVTAAVPRPLGVTADDIPAAVVEKERKFRIEQAMESGKPQEIAEKIVEGGMRKFFSEIALLEQPFIMDPAKTVKDIVGAATIVGFVRWQVGESTS
ncbi:MAG: translation elongation factor Ts [Phycisphaeraceae bacterium]|nr:translation elongation factor Ts [Phycisphaeraceae bacterium]